MSKYYLLPENHIIKRLMEPFNREILANGYFLKEDEVFINEEEDLIIANYYRNNNEKTSITINKIKENDYSSMHLVWDSNKLTNKKGFEKQIIEGNFSGKMSIDRLASQIIRDNRLKFVELIK